MLLAAWAFALSPAVDDGAEAGLAALHSLEKVHRAVQFLSADYVQERTTPLLRKPLISEGRLAFRRRPGCLVLHTHKPRETIMRLDETSYQVYRPHRKQLEKFLIDDQRWQKVLFQTLSHQVGEIEKDFEVLRSAVEENTRGAVKEVVRVVTLKPRGEKIAERIRLLQISVIESEAVVRRVAYVDTQGDEIKIELTKINRKTELPDERFSMTVPDGTQIIVHDTEKED